MIEETVQEKECEEARARLRDRGSRFLGYLAAVAREQGVKTPHQIEKSLEYVLSTQLTDTPSLFTIGPTRDSAAWFTMEQVSKPNPVHIPENLKPYVDPRSVKRTTSMPKLGVKYEALKEQSGNQSLSERERQTIAGRVAEIQQAFASWKTTTWAVWCMGNRLLERSYDLYQKLFSIYLQVSGESDTIELLFGHAILTWNGRKKVDYPLVLTPAHMVFHEETGAIQVIPEGDPRMSTDPWESTDLFGFKVLTELQDRFNSDPVDLWDVDEYGTFENHIVSSLGSSARIKDGIDLTAGDEPRLQRGWVLMLRNRVDNHGAFYRKLAEKLQQSDYLPIAFDSMFSDMKTIRMAVGDVSMDDGTADRLLMPLPANSEQARIVKQLAKSAGVTVQGPPGTGKSHTIVNLIAHLLSQGKRVLVTAEKEQALSVLQDKLPESIRDFAVASIGTSSADANDLRLSVQRMQDSLSELDVDRAQSQIIRLSHRMDECEKRLALIDQDLMGILASETERFETPNGPMRADDVAKWVRDNTDLNVVPDRIESGTQAPLTIDEFKEYVRLCSTLSVDDVAECRKNLPDGSLPTGDYLADAFRELADVQRKVSTLALAGLNMEVVDSTTERELKETLLFCRKSLEELRALDGEWEREFGRFVRGSRKQREWLRDGVGKLQSEISKCMDLERQCRGHQIVIPEGDPSIQTELLDRWSNRLAQGKGLPKIFNRELRDFASTVTFDGYQPHTVEQLNVIKVFIKERVELSRLDMLVKRTYEGIPVPVVDVSENTLPVLADTADKTLRLIIWWNDDAPRAYVRLRALFHGTDPIRDLETLEGCVSALEGYAARNRENEIRRMLDMVADICERHTLDGYSNLWRLLSSAFEQRDTSAWQTTLDEAARLSKVRADAARRDELGMRLSKAAPQWSSDILETKGTAAGETWNYPRAWALAQANAWVCDIVQSADMGSLLDESLALNTELHETVLKLISWSARLHLKEVQDPDDRRSLNIWLEAVRKYGKGTGKNALRYLSTARRELPKAMNAMPVWIMPLHKVLENFDPLVSHPFDVIIVDESSQCNILSVGVLALADKAVIVGDDKQTSPSGAFQRLDAINRIQEQYIPDFSDKTLLDMRDSLYAMANRTFPSTIMLREHFRCVPEIIDYSNRFYDNQIFPLREKTHPQIGSPLRFRRVKGAEVEKRGNDSVNLVEAEAIVEQMAACCGDQRYDGMTFGVVTMMSGQQSSIIRDMLIEKIGEEEFVKRRLRVGNPPDFQGDERNVIFISFVANSNSYAATQQSHAQWANVAASRAKDQLWVFYSMDPSTLNVNDYRRGLIEYVRDCGTEEGPREEASFASGVKTGFERDVFDVLCDFGYREESTYRHQVGRYRIDYVIDMGNGCRVALECDGDRNSDPELDRIDIEKQRILERLGWRFIRLSAPAFYLDRDGVTGMLKRRLDDLKNQSRQIAEMLGEEVAREKSLLDSSVDSCAVLETDTDTDSSVDSADAGSAELPPANVAVADAPTTGAFSTGTSADDLRFVRGNESSVDTVLEDSPTIVEPAVEPAESAGKNDALEAVGGEADDADGGEVAADVADATDFADVADEAAAGFADATDVTAENGAAVVDGNRDDHDGEDDHGSQKTETIAAETSSVAVKEFLDAAKLSDAEVSGVRRKKPQRMRGFIVDSLVKTADLPVKDDLEPESKWFRSVLMTLVLNEFPLNRDLIREQVTELVGDSMSEDKCRKMINDGLDGLEYAGLIRREYDHYYYPATENVAFRICRGKRIRLISEVELASVMRLICVNEPGLPKNRLFEGTMELYGFNKSNKAIDRSLGKAFDLLRDLRLVRVERRRFNRVYAEGPTGDTPDRPFGVVLKAMEEKRANQSAARNNPKDGVSSPASRVVDLPTGEWKKISAVKSQEPVKSQERESFLDKSERESAEVSGFNSESKAESSMSREFTTYGERYGLSYAEPVDMRMLPGRDRYVSDEVWLESAVVFLVREEFPLVYGMLRKQLMGPMIQAGIEERRIDEYLRAAIRNSSDRVKCGKDVLMPVDRSGLHFRIIRRREIDFISESEISYVMRHIIRACPGRDRNFLFDEAFLVYGFRSNSTKIEKAFGSVLNSLVKKDKVRFSHGGFYLA